MAKLGIYRKCIWNCGTFLYLIAGIQYLGNKKNIPVIFYRDYKY